MKDHQKNLFMLSCSFSKIRKLTAFNGIERMRVTVAPWNIRPLRHINRIDSRKLWHSPL